MVKVSGSNGWLRTTILILTYLIFAEHIFDRPYTTNLRSGIFYLRAVLITKSGFGFRVSCFGFRVANPVTTVFFASYYSGHFALTYNEIIMFFSRVTSFHKILQHDIIMIMRMMMKMLIIMISLMKIIELLVYMMRL